MGRHNNTLLVVLMVTLVLCLGFVGVCLYKSVLLNIDIRNAGCDATSAANTLMYGGMSADRNTYFTGVYTMENIGKKSS